MTVPPSPVQVLTRAAFRCEWPHCPRRAVECAHLQSKGLGGSNRRDGWDNVMAACEIHARVTDGLPGPGQSQDDYRIELESLLGRPVTLGAAGTGRAVWTTLQRVVAANRGGQ